MDLQHFSEESTTASRKALIMRAMLALTALLVLGATVGALALRSFAAPVPFVALPNSVAPQVATARLVGATAIDQKISLSLALRSKNSAGLKEYANQVATPKAQFYRQYLTPAQFAAAFGADPRTLANAEQYLQANGFHLENVASGGLVASFSGTVAQAETAFKVHINNYQLDGRSFFANAENIQIPAALNGAIYTVTGLETARQVHPNVAAAPTKSGTTAHPNTVVCSTSYTTAYTASTTNSALYTLSGMTAQQLQTLYNFPTTGTPGQNTWAAFLEFDGFALSDVAQYANCANLSSTIQNNISGSASSSSPFIIVQNSAQSYSTIPNPSTNYGTPLPAGNSAAQVTADLEVLLGLAPNLKNISVIQNNNTSNGFLAALSLVVNENAAQVIGISWSMCEADAGFGLAQAEQQLLMQAALQGQSVFGATGNNGLYACYGDGNGLRQNSFSVQDPASDPYITAVGGTTVATKTNTANTGLYGAEQPWTSTTPSTGIAANGAGAGGGGISLFWAAPTWQTSADAAFTVNPNAGGGNAPIGVLSAYVGQTVNNATVAARVIPDVSAAADPTYSSVAIFCSAGGSPCSSGTTTFTAVGGTGVATAIWVAAASLAVQSANPSAAPPQVGVRLGLVAPMLYQAYQNDVVTNSTTSVGSPARTFCDYTKLGNAAVGSLTSFNVACGGGVLGGYILNNTVPFANATVYVTSTFTATAANGFQQPPATSTQMYGQDAGFAVKGGTSGVPAPTYISGYNALTGLGSPNVGTLNTSASGATNGTGLVGYLAAATRVAIPRVYMVAQASSSSTYWLASYAFNPYVQNMPSNTQWYQLSSTQNFSGAPTIVDDGKFGGTGAGNQATNLYIIGPSSATTSGIGIIQWNIATQTATSITTQTSATGLPGAAPNNTCSAVNAFTNATFTTPSGNIEVYCLTPGGNLYSTTITTFGNGTRTISNTIVINSWSSSAIFNQNISSPPQVASDGNGNYLVLTQTTGTSYAVLYQYFASGWGSLTTTPSFSFTTLATTCNSTPAVSYVSRIGAFAAACIANDTKAMWANFFNTSSTKFNPFWTFLGQPSSSVTFKPGAAVAADNVGVTTTTLDPGYGNLLYIAQGSDNGMYLSVVNTAQTNFLAKTTGWQSISLPGIFSTGSAAAFENA